MEELPITKPPSDFTGKGFEVIGDPSGQLGEGMLWFQDGRILRISLPPEEDPPWTPETAKKWKRNWRIDEAEALALRLRDDPTDADAGQELTELQNKARTDRKQGEGRHKALEDAIDRIANATADNPPLLKTWPSRFGRSRAMVLALMETSKFGPPIESEVIDAMQAATDTKDGVKILAGERKHLVKFLRESGFGWLERVRRT